MKPLPYKLAYRRKLPHFQPENTPLFVTFRLKGSVPREVVEKLEASRIRFQNALEAAKIENRAALKLQFERASFIAAENALDRRDGPLWLEVPDVAQILEESLKHRDGSEYTLDAYCIMANHVHVVFTPLNSADGTPHSLARILKSLKGFTAKRCNEILKRTGSFWEAESYDHYVRSETEWLRIIQYVLNNPVKAGLTKIWTDWKWSYCRFGEELNFANNKG